MKSELRCGEGKVEPCRTTGLSRHMMQVYMYVQCVCRFNPNTSLNAIAEMPFNALIV